MPDRDTSTAGKSAATFELTYTGFGDISPYALLKLKEFDGPLDDDELRLGIRWFVLSGVDYAPLLAFATLSQT